MRELEFECMPPLSKCCCEHTCMLFLRDLELLYYMTSTLKRKCITDVSLVNIRLLPFSISCQQFSGLCLIQKKPQRNFIASLFVIIFAREVL